MATLSSKLIISADDRASGPLARLRGLFNGIRREPQGLATSGHGGLGMIRGALAATGAYVGIREAMQGTVGASIAFEEKFAEVRKVVDGAPADVNRLRGSILGLSKTLPVAASGLADIMAAAGQAGITLADLPKFTEFTAKAAIAFDMSEGETGQRFAELRNVFKLNQSGLEELANASNLLSNGMASSAGDITDFVNRAAGAAGVLNLLPRELAAVGSAMASAGIAPETAARGLSAFTNKIVAGGPKVRSAFKAIGLSFKEWRALQKQNGPKALQQLFDHAGKSGEKGLRALQDLVGQDFSDDFSKLLANPDLLRQALDMVSDSSKVAGSVQAEFINKSDTAAAKIQLLKNNVAALGIAFGDLIAPTIGNWAKDLAGTLATLGSRVTVFDSMKAKMDAFVGGLGMQGIGDAGAAWKSFSDAVFGRENDDKAEMQMLVQAKRWREIGENFRAAFNGWGGDSTIGDRLTSLKDGLSGLGGSMTTGTVLSLVGAAVALKGIGGALGMLGLGKIAKVGLLAYGLSALATSGTDMSAIDWAALGIGLASMAGSLKTLAALGTGLAGVAAFLAASLNWAQSDALKSDEEVKRSEAVKKRIREEFPQTTIYPSHTEERGRDTNTGLPQYIQQRDRQAELDRFNAGPFGPRATGPIETRPTGTQDVRVTNPPPRPNISVSVGGVHVTTNASPDAIGAAVGERVKSAVESVFGDGGGGL